VILQAHVNQPRPHQKAGAKLGTKYRTREVHLYTTPIIVELYPINLCKGNSVERSCVVLQLFVRCSISYYDMALAWRQTLRRWSVFC